MNVTFDIGEEVNGYKIKTRNGLSEFVAENARFIICFRTDSGEGRNYSIPMWYTDKFTGRQYRAMKYLYKFVRTVQGFSNALYDKYREVNQ